MPWTSIDSMLSFTVYFYVRDIHLLLIFVYISGTLLDVLMQWASCLSGATIFCCWMFMYYWYTITYFRVRRFVSLKRCAIAAVLDEIIMPD